MVSSYNGLLKKDAWNILGFQSLCMFLTVGYSQYTNDVVLTSVRPRFNVTVVVLTSVLRRVLNGFKALCFLWLLYSYKKESTVYLIKVYSQMF